MTFADWVTLIVISSTVGMCMFGVMILGYTLQHGVTNNDDVKRRIKVAISVGIISTLSFSIIMIILTHII